MERGIDLATTRNFQCNRCATARIPARPVAAMAAVVVAFWLVAGCVSQADGGGERQSSVVIPPPTLTISTGTTSFAAPSNPIAVDPALTLTYPDGPNLTGARVSIAAGYVSSQDSLAVASQNGISGSYNAGAGILTLTGTATAANYELALRSVTYANSAGASPDVRERQISFAIGASSLFFADTQHYYEFVTSAGITWTAARTAAASRTFFGLQGYLVTATTAAENSFVASKLAGQGWIGASDDLTEGTWRWATGPEGTESSGAGRIFFNQTLGVCNGPGGACGAAVGGGYFNWAGGEPNNAGGEDYAHFLSDGRWNDYPNSVGSSIQGYVAEYGGMTSDPVVQISGTKTLTVTAGCTLDSHCVAGKFCVVSTKMCTAKLEPGAAIPDDTLHGGLCNPTNASAVCSSSACNGALHTCASTNGAGCTSTAMCVSNVCGTNGFCGATNGAAGCTLITASAFCQSGRCSSSGVCIPAAAGSCYIDGDCAAGHFCRRDLFACKPSLNAGVSIPDDGLHGAACSVTVALAVCTAGGCNVATGTCADHLGAICSEAAACVGNVCGLNGRCGYTDGSGSCSATTAATACQSGTCSAGAVCMPAGADRCWVDSDCGNGSYCDRELLTCAAKLASSAAIPNDGLHDGTCAGAANVCASGLCNATTSTCAGVNGSNCENNGGCVGNTCGSNGRCGIAVGDGACLATNGADLCQSGVCSVANVCAPGGVGGCWVDADCDGGQYCDTVALLCHGKLGAGSPLPVDRLHDGVCSSGLAATICLTGGCNAVTNSCASAAGAQCASPAECIINVCNSGGACGYGFGEGSCQISNAATRCAAGPCSSAGVCLSARPDGCWADADCVAGSFCDRRTSVCQRKYPAGTILLVDAIHDGRCTTTMAQAVCMTGACNDLTHTCSASAGAACAVAADCTTNVCASNKKCGLIAGNGPCTSQDAASSCQSGVCGPESAVCVPAVSGGCGSDADCSTAQYCDGTTLICVGRLATGASLPADGKHATCVNGRNSACGDGLCNVVASTCASANGATCTAPRTCASNACGSNGKCGLDDGQPGCTVATAAVCQTGVCTAGGVCGELGCAADAQCPQASAFCDGSVGLCTAKLLVGQALPTDSLHDGRCNSSSAGASCASGACNAINDTCALPNAQPCQAGGECATNACGSDGLCGLVDGEAGCTTASAAVCRSGICSAKANHCLPAGGGRCAVDADCTGATFCARATLTCVPRLASGTAIPKDGLHDDGCLPGIGTAVCQSGLCNPVTTTCAGATGATCAVAGECTTGICGTNGICGLVAGAGPCDSSSGADVCQSGVCSVKLGRCKPTRAGSCLEDVDCEADSFCAGTTLTCVKKLARGASVPNDGLHGGVCDKTIAKAVCASAQCNAQANSCAGANGETCSTAAECVGGACAADGMCGKTAGGSCDRLGDCRSGLCTAGLCVAEALTPGVANSSSGCDCRVGGAGGTGGELIALTLFAAVWFARRRQRSQAAAAAAGRR